MDRSLIKTIFTEKNRRKRKREFNFICVDLNMHSNKSIQTCPPDIHFQRDSRIKSDNRLADFRYWTDTEFKSYVSKFFDISPVFLCFTFLRAIPLFTFMFTFASVLRMCSRVETPNDKRGLLFWFQSRNIEIQKKKLSLEKKR